MEIPIAELAKRPPQDLYLRRFVNGVVPEVLEILPARAQMTAMQVPADAACMISVQTDGDTQIYHVLLPENLIVRPVDWRRFAYDHEKVVNLLSVCARDNLAPLVFAPNSDEVRKQAETNLMVALGDLSSIFDTKSVRCEWECIDEISRIVTTLKGEHKNGECIEYRFLV
jgi:hypothetical protein